MKYDGENPYKKTLFTGQTNTLVNSHCVCVSLPGVPAGPPLPPGAAEATGQDIVHDDAVPRFRSRFRCR